MERWVSLPVAWAPLKASVLWTMRLRVSRVCDSFGTSEGAMISSARTWAIFSTGTVDGRSGMAKAFPWTGQRINGKRLSGQACKENAQSRKEEARPQRPTRKGSPTAAGKLGKRPMLKDARG